MNTFETVNNAIEHLTVAWKLSNLRPLVKMPPVNNYAGMAYSGVYKKDVVLKILLADTMEPETLKLFNGNGSVKLLVYDPKYKGLLLEYVYPGTSLKSLFPAHDAQAVEIAAEIIKKLHAKSLIAHAQGFETVNQWLALLSSFQSKKISAQLLKKAQKLSEQLLSTKQAPYVLHGDLHHENILQDGQGWISIDPKGVVGPLEYEFGRFIMNPIPDLLQPPNAQEIIKHRIERFSKIFGIEQQRLRDWAFVQAVLSACWTERGGSEEFFNHFMKFAKVVELVHYS
jgi:streptomycin 6-kinase